MTVGVGGCVGGCPLPWRLNIPGRYVGAHGSPCSPAESVQREGVPCATPAKLLYCVMHPAWRETDGDRTQHTHTFNTQGTCNKPAHKTVALTCGLPKKLSISDFRLTTLAASVKPSTAAQRRPRANTEEDPRHVNSTNTIQPVELEGGRTRLDRNMDRAVNTCR